MMDLIRFYLFVVKSSYARLWQGLFSEAPKLEGTLSQFQMHQGFFPLTYKVFKAWLLCWLRLFSQSIYLIASIAATLFVLSVFTPLLWAILLGAAPYAYWKNQRDLKTKADSL